jgi:hypothetical protein
VPNFANIKASVPIEQAARFLNLGLHQEKHQLRGACPACQTTDNRKLALTPSASGGVFFCHAAKTGGSVIDLVAHILGLSLIEAGQWLEDTLPHSRDTPDGDSSRTAPPKPEGAPPPSASTAAAPARPKAGSVPFDPVKFGQGLQFTDAVAALGLTEDLARQFRIGTHRGKLYAPICPADVEPQTWMECTADGKFRLPAKWLEPNIVPFKRRA